MKISIAQTRPVKGDIAANIEAHKNLIQLALSHRSEMVFFPELSITGYEPELAKDLATTKDDKRFDEFQQISDLDKIIIGIGVPTKNSDGINISMVVFQPHQSRQTYSKMYLHADEEPFFVSGQGSIDLLENNIALAICYEISIPEHSENAHRKGAEIYIASVAKTESGVTKAIENLSDIAKKYSMKILMCNSVGPSDNFIAAGKSSCWDNKGNLLGQLDANSEGLLILDTQMDQLTQLTL